VVANEDTEREGKGLYAHGKKKLTKKKEKGLVWGEHFTGMSDALGDGE